MVKWQEIGKRVTSLCISSYSLYKQVISSLSTVVRDILKICILLFNDENEILHWTVPFFNNIPIHTMYIAFILGNQLLPQFSMHIFDSVHTYLRYVPGNMTPAPIPLVFNLPTFLSIKCNLQHGHFCT